MTDDDTQQSRAPALLNVHDVAARYGVSEQTIWHWMRIGRFPQPMRLTPGCSRWTLAMLETHEAELNGERCRRHQWNQRYRRRRARPMQRTRPPQRAGG